MGARLRNLFSRRRAQEHDQLRLRAHPYELTVKQTSPIKGTRPIAGNGPYRLENVALQNQELGAEPPTVPRSRRDSDSYRPRTAPQSAPLKSYRRSRSSFSLKAPSNAASYAYEPSLVTSNHRRPTSQRVRSVSIISSDSRQPHKQSAHVDILDAVSRMNPSAQALTQKRIASGKRDYGEDVADRNIAEFGGDEFPEQDAYSYYTVDAAPSSSPDEPGQGMPDGTERLDSRDGSTRGPVRRFESDGTGDDTTPLNQLAHQSTSRIYPNVDQNPGSSMPLTAAHSHARRESGSSDYSNATDTRGKGRPGRSPSIPTDAGPFVIPAPRSNASTSTNLYYMSGGLDHAVSTNEPNREAATNTSQPIRRSRESRGTQTTPPSPEPIVITPVAPLGRFSLQDIDDSSSDDSYDPLPISRCRLSRLSILPTPPMSPITGGSPTTSIPRASLDKELPPPPTDTQPSLTSKKHSRGGSASYSVSPTQDSGRNARGKGLHSTVTTSESSSADVLSKDRKRDDLVSGTSPGPSRIEGIGDTSNTTVTEVLTTQLPAVVHEHVTPQIHHVKEERITREIHNHDVFHRIQPIIDVEILPTKHYKPAPNGNGLIEIPESELPGRHTKWAVRPVDDKLGTSASVPLEADIKTTAKHPDFVGDREPIVQDRQKVMTDDGITRERTVWRHPPRIEKGGEESGQTVPLTINHYNDEDKIGYDDAASERYAASDPYAGSERSFSTNAGGEEELLFRDSDLAFDGLLPGLEEVNPVIEKSVSLSRPSTATTKTTHKGDDVGEGEATKALRRKRETELAQKMGRLSLIGRR